MNTPIFGGPPGGSSLVIFGDFINAFGPVSNIVGRGNDRINVLNLHATRAACANDSFGIFFDSGIGNDRVEISNTSARFSSTSISGTVTTTLTFNANTLGERPPSTAAPASTA